MAARGSGDYLTKRDGFWHYVRRVPLALAGTDKRRFAKQSTNIRVADDPRGQRARKAAAIINVETERYWQTLLEGRAAESEARYKAARQRARLFGYDYATAGEVANRPIEEIIARLERLMTKDLAEDDQAQVALTGAESPPEIMLDGLFAEYEKLERTSLSDMSDDQKRKWRNPKKRAVANLKSVIGDKAIHLISRSDALDFREWWQDRVEEEGVEIATANKDIGHLNRMLRTIDKRHRLGMSPIFADLRIEGETAGSRRPFDRQFIQDKLLAAGALRGLNDEARDVIYVMVETGMRPSEIVNLTASTIHLAAPIPYVQAMPEGRRMKTKHSERDMPLVGIALEALRRRPEGFPRYRDNAATLSGTVNKYLSENGLRPTEKHTLYSLRHSFEDRLTAVDPPDKIIASLMGHKFHRPKYGAGPSLELKAQWLQRIAFMGIGI